MYLHVLLHRLSLNVHNTGYYFSLVKNGGSPYIFYDNSYVINEQIKWIILRVLQHGFGPIFDFLLPDSWLILVLRKIS